MCVFLFLVNINLSLNYVTFDLSVDIEFNSFHILIVILIKHLHAIDGLSIAMLIFLILC